MQDRIRLLEQLREYVLPKRAEQIHEVASHRTDMIRVVVEDTHYEHNSGAVVRSCDCFGVQKIYMIQQKSQFKVSRNVSKGSHKWLTFHEFKEPSDRNNTEDCLLQLKNEGYQLVATTPHQPDVYLPDFEIQGKTAFLFGNERNGLSDDAMSLADTRLAIPNYGFTGSYNVSVSAALVLQQAVYQMHRSDLEWRLSDEERVELEIEWLVKAMGRPGRHLLEKLIQENE